MSGDHQVPRVLVIWRNSHFAFVGLGLVLAVWMFALFFTVLNFVESAFDRQFMPPWVAIAVAFVPTLIYMAIQARRVSATRRVFREGQRVDGKVTDLWFEGNGGAALYEYEWQGTHYTGRHIFTSRRQFDALSRGKVIELVVDAEHPQRAFIQLFYETPPHPRETTGECDNNVRLGCGAYLGIAIISMLLAGFVAAQVGLVIQPHVNDDILAGRLAFLAGIDAVALVVLCYSRSRKGAASRERLYPLYVGLAFFVLGMKCGCGSSLAGPLLWGAINSIIGLTTWLVLLGKGNPTETAQQ